MIDGFAVGNSPSGKGGCAGTEKEKPNGEVETHRARLLDLLKPVFSCEFDHFLA